MWWDDHFLFVMVWNHPKAFVCYGRMFQLRTSLYKRQGQSEYENLVKNSNQKKMADNRSLGSKQALFCIAWDFFHPFTFFDHIGQPWTLCGLFFLGWNTDGKGKSTVYVDECATPLPMCPFLNSGFPLLFVFNIHDKPFSKEVHLKANDQRRCLVPFGV